METSHCFSKVLISNWLIVDVFPSTFSSYFEKRRLSLFTFIFRPTVLRGYERKRKKIRMTSKSCVFRKNLLHAWNKVEILPRWLIITDFLLLSYFLGSTRILGLSFSFLLPVSLPLLLLLLILPHNLLQRHLNIFLQALKYPRSWCDRKINTVCRSITRYLCDWEYFVGAGKRPTRQDKKCVLQIARRR